MLTWFLWGQLIRIESVHLLAGSGGGTSVGRAVAGGTVGPPETDNVIISESFCNIFDIYL